MIGPGDAIEHNARITQQLDWEVELAVIMGAPRAWPRPTRCPTCSASVMLDMSARDCRRAGQWIYSRARTPMRRSACIVTADEIPDPQKLDLWLTVNGEKKQGSNTRHMLFKVPFLISDISAGITLEPGDIIATGTPEGVGAAAARRNGCGRATWSRPALRHRHAAPSGRGRVKAGIPTMNPPGAKRRAMQSPRGKT